MLIYCLDENKSLIVRNNMISKITMKRENVKKSFDIDGYKFYKTKNGTLRKAKLCTNEKSEAISDQEFMNAWNRHYDLYYA